MDNTDKEYFLDKRASVTRSDEFSNLPPLADDVCAIDRIRASSTQLLIRLSLLF